MVIECPNCAENFKRIGIHWSKSSCEYPSLTEEQREITVGLLMGDGSIHRQEISYPRLRSEMITKEYLEYIDNKFGILGTGVSVGKTPKESAEINRNSGLYPNAEAENYSTTYVWRTRTHPEFKEFADWYSTGEKIWPESIELTPTVLKHWYCGDGYLDDNTKNNITISITNEIENTEKVTNLFENMGLPSPSNYNTYKRKDGREDCKAQFTASQSNELWKYMGEPLPGFEYKWPEEYRNSY